MKKGVNLGSIFLTFKEYKRFKVIKEYYYGFWDDSCFTSLQMTRSYSQKTVNHTLTTHQPTWV